MKKLVVFDLDGTLVDSIKDLGNAVNFALSKHNLPLNPMADYYTFVGNGMEDLVRKSMRDKGASDEFYKVVRKDFDEYYNAHSNDNTTPYKGITELLLSIKAKGARVAVLTNKAHCYVGEILNKCFPDFQFDLYVGQRAEVKRKPHPEAFEMLLDELKIAKSEALYVGDSEVDVKTALNAGVDMAIVTWGYRSLEELISAGAENIVNSPEEILNYV